MLAKQRRLNLKVNYKWVATGKTFQTPHFKIMFKMGENENALVGIALSSTTFKKAVERNRAKRLTSKAVEDLYTQLPKAMNLVIMPKAAVLDLHPEALEEEIKSVKALFETN